jgi:type VI protein secretion system component VasF
MNEIIDTLQEEETNLVLHTKLCAQRYEQITDRLNRMDQRFDRVEAALIEIKNAVSAESKDNYKMYLMWAGVIITTLIGATGYLLTHYVLK